MTACVGVHLAAVHGRAFAGNEAGLRAAVHNLLEHSAEHGAVTEAAMPVLAEALVGFWGGGCGWWCWRVSGVMAEARAANRLA